MQSTVDVDVFSGDVTGLRRTQKGDHVGNIKGLAKLTNRYAFGKAGLTFGGRVHAFVDLFAVDSARSDAVDVDPEFPNIARQSLRPCMHRSLGSIGRADAAMRLRAPALRYDPAGGLAGLLETGLIRPRT